MLGPRGTPLVSTAFFDLLDAAEAALRRIACVVGRHAGGEVALDAQLEMVAHQDDQSLVKVTCAHCQDVRVIAVAIAAETAAAPVIEVRDEPVDELGAAITTNDVLDARLALAGYEGDLASLLR